VQHSTHKTTVQTLKRQKTIRNFSQASHNPQKNAAYGYISSGVPFRLSYVPIRRRSPYFKSFRRGCLDAKVGYTNLLSCSNKAEVLRVKNLKHTVVKCRQFSVYLYNVSFYVRLSHTLLKHKVKLYR